MNSGMFSGNNNNIGAVVVMENAIQFADQSIQYTSANPPISTIAANITLTKANTIGQNIRFITNNSLVATLPSAASVPNGSSIQFTAATFNNTISRAGADNIFLPTGNVTSIPISIGSMIRLTSDGVSLWYADIIPSSGFLNTFVTADAGLNISDVAIYDFVGQVSMALKLLTATDQIYEIDIYGTYTAAVAAVVSYLQVNNTNFAAGFTIRQIFSSNNTANGTNAAGVDSGFRLETLGASILEGRFTAFTKTSNKKAIGISASTTTTVGASATLVSEMADTTTVWTSLGTIIMPNSWTGRIRVKRVM